MPVRKWDGKLLAHDYETAACCVSRGLVYKGRKEDKKEREGGKEKKL